MFVYIKRKQINWVDDFNRINTGTKTKIRYGNGKLKKKRQTKEKIVIENTEEMKKWLKIGDAGRNLK